jgi:dienelactone hydrolase
VKLPVLIWGEGGCAANGLAFARFLTEIASHGFFVIASGAPNGSGSTTSKMMKDAIDWIVSKAGSRAYASVDASKIAVAGQSCGGVEAYDMKMDERVSVLGIFNSGLLQNTAEAGKVKKPIFYFLGGGSDIAYANVSLP